MYNNLKYHAKLLTATWLLLCFIAPATATQPISISIGDQARCQHSDVLIPVHASEFLNVAAITLYLQINTTGAEYISILNPNAELGNGHLVANFNEAQAQIIISWASIVPANIKHGKLFDIQLAYHSGMAPVTFLEHCEIALFDKEVTIAENVQYDDGLIFPVEINILEHPVSMHVDEGLDAHFSTVAEDAGNLLFRWQMHNGTRWVNLDDDDRMQGTHTGELIIYNVLPDLNNTLWRCMVFVDDCYDYSHPALLSVSEVTGVQSPAVSGYALNVFPNPASGYLHYDAGNISAAFDLQLLNATGDVVYRQYNAPANGKLSVQALVPGVYFLQLLAGNKPRQTVKVVVVK